MKTILKISVLLNVIFLGGVLLLWRQEEARVQSPQSAVQASELRPIAAPAVQTVVEMAPFRWSQLSSANDYRAFVANLRAAGCPEATVEDIVRGNTGRAYAMMRERLGVSATEPGRWSEEAQMQMVAYFLGQSPNAEETTGTAEASAAPAATGQNNQAASNPQTGPVTLASFLENADLTTPGMSAEQKQEVGALRQSLLAQISGAGQAANSQGNPSSQSGAENNQSSSTADNNAPSQTGSENAEPAQNGAGPQRQYSQAALTALQNSGSAAALAGLFGPGAAIQYEMGSQAH